MATGPILDRPAARNHFHQAFIARIAEAFTRVTGTDFEEETGLPRGNLGEGAWSGDFALLTHRGDQQATLNYGNATALRLWECGWEEFVGLPSVATAPAEAVEARADMMQRVARDGFVRGYGGVRISRKGRLFRIENGIVWRLLEAAGESFGVGAFFSDYRYL